MTSRQIASAAMAVLASLAPTLTSAAETDPTGSAAQIEVADPNATNTVAGSSSVEQGGIENYFEDWFTRVTRAQSEQPSWPALINLPPPYLVEQLRYDQYIEHLGNDASIRNFGVNKGIQVVPTNTEEIDIGVPSYIERTNKMPATGFGDWQAATFKQRLLAAPPSQGDYVVSAFVSMTVPTGASAFTNHVYFISPNIGGGKGWGRFDVQATFGALIPTSRAGLYGNELLGNLGLQYHLGQYIWPEVEFNWTDWVSGHQRGGKDQVFMTVGAVLGKFQIMNRLGVALGLGYQFPLTPSFRTQPAILPLYSRNFIASLRVPF